jgi:hypothetical protein
MTYSTLYTAAYDALTALCVIGAVVTVVWCLVAAALYAWRTRPRAMATRRVTL